MNNISLTPTTNNTNSLSLKLKGSSKDMMYYYSLLLNNWYLLALGLIVATGLYYVKMRYTKPIYRVAGSVMIEDINQKSVTNDMITEKLGFDKEVSNIEDRIRLLSSTELMERVVDSLRLNVAYVQEGHIVRNELFNQSPLRLQYWNTEGVEKSFQLKILHHDSANFKLFKSESETEIIKYGAPFSFGKRELILRKTGALNGQYPINIVVNDAYNVAQNYSSRLDITQSGRSNVLNMALLDEVPDRAVAIINRLIREYEVFNMEGNNESGRRTLRFIDERLDYVTKELYSVEKSEEGFKQDRNLPILIPEMTKNYLDKTNAVDMKIEGFDNRLAFVNNIERIITASSTHYQALPFSTEILSSGPLTGLIQRYNDLIAKRNAMLESAKEGNPILTSFDEQLKDLKENILITVQTIKQEVNEQKERARQQLIPLESQINTMPTNQRELTKIMREKGVKETLFLFLLQKREETALTVAAQTAHSRLLERATNRGIVSPQPVQLALFCLFLGLGLPIMFLYIKDLLNNKVYHRAEIDKYLDLPFVGFIPHVRGQKNKLILNDSHSILAESFRLIRSNLQTTATENQKNRTILITSTVSSEGKSFIATNLALTLALTGRKVMLLGLDLRKPQISTYLTGQRAKKGVSNFLKREAELEDIIESLPNCPNLDYIDCGPIPRNPSELMMTEQMKNLFTTLQKRYDFIVVDGAPIGIVADSFLLKDYVGQTLVVLRYGYSTTAHLKFMNEVHVGDKLPNMNTLLNDLRSERGNAYNYGYYMSTYYQEKEGIWTRFKKLFKRKRKAQEVDKYPSFAHTNGQMPPKQPKRNTTASSNGKVVEKK
jgi:tyrosine-protein kinase Etk/Wzc